ncbi:MAG TPA: hypothetical protein VJL89_06120, partial [Thermodesulfovibrionia bacterium]|nr:hypothetical protein [Thermodesulfovibrionia bacterium]
MTSERKPYKYLDYYTFEDRDLFYGREKEVMKMVGEILSTRLLVLFSPSGSGKTSLIHAGVRPQLEDMGYKTVYCRMQNEPVASVKDAAAKSLELDYAANQDLSLHEFLKMAYEKAQKPLILFLDQFEEFFIVFKDKPEERKQFIRAVADVRYDDNLPVYIVLSLREDYFA